jgi:hypothetical protein
MLIALVISAIAPAATQMGYPIFVRADGELCSYQIQDMILHDEAQVSDWMQKVMPLWRVDIIHGEDNSDECIKKATSILERAGYLNVVVRRGSEAEYGGLGPPR